MSVMAFTSPSLARGTAVYSGSLYSIKKSSNAPWNFRVRAWFARIEAGIGSDAARDHSPQPDVFAGDPGLVVR
jgi:hypothetical protein